MCDDFLYDFVYDIMAAYSKFTQLFHMMLGSVYYAMKELPVKTKSNLHALHSSLCQ